MMERILKEFAHSYDGGEIAVSLTGGEPLLLGEDFFRRVVEIQKALLPCKFSNALRSNLTLLTDGFIELFRDNNFEVRTSLDLPSDHHDRLRLAGNFSKTMAAIKRLQSAGVPVNINTVVTSQNIGYPEEIYQTLRELGVNSFSVSGMVLQGNGLDNPELAIPTNADFGRFLIRLFDLWANDPESPIKRITPLDYLLRSCNDYLSAQNQPEPESGLGQSPCFVCQEQLIVVGPTGDVYPSCNKFFGFPRSCLGSLASQDLQTILESDCRRRFFEQIRQATRRICPHCEFYPICQGGCYYAAYTAIVGGTEITSREQFCRGYHLTIQHLLKWLETHQCDEGGIPYHV